MTRRLLLLVLCAVLMIASSLAGQGGPMANLVGMDRENLARSIDDAGHQAVAGAASDDSQQRAQAQAQVAPSAWAEEDGDFEGAFDEPAFEADTIGPDDPEIPRDTRYIDSAPPVMDENNFDPRIG